MTDTRRGAKFAANCLQCSEAFDDFVAGLGVANRIEPLRLQRNQWMNDHAVSTRHTLFEYADTEYRRVELLVMPDHLRLDAPERGLNP